MSCSAASFCTILADGILQAIKISLSNRRPASVMASTSRLKGWAWNRRFVMCDGNIETHPLKGDPRIVEAEGPDSEAIAVLCCLDEGNICIGAAVCFGCHPTVMERRNKLISADFCGKVVSYLETELLAHTESMSRATPFGGLACAICSHESSLEHAR